MHIAILFMFLYCFRKVIKMYNDVCIYIYRYNYVKWFCLGRRLQNRSELGKKGNCLGLLLLHTSQQSKHKTCLCVPYFMAIRGTSTMFWRHFLGTNWIPAKTGTTHKTSQCHQYPLLSRDYLIIYVWTTRVTRGSANPPQLWHKTSLCSIMMIRA